MKKEDIKIRKAVETDYNSVNSLYFHTYNLYFQNIPESYKETPKELLSKGTFLNILDDKKTLLIVAEYNEKVIGVLYALIESADDDEVTHGYYRVSVDEVSVHPDFRSKGVGTLLMKEAENWAKENKITDLTTLVYSFNDRAINFYKKNGYDPYSLKLNKKIK